MRRGKKGEKIFESLKESENFIKKELSLEAHIARKKKEGKMNAGFVYDNPQYRLKKLLKIIRTYLDGIHNEKPRKVLSFVATMRAKGCGDEQIYTWLANHYKCRVDQIKDVERIGVEKIKDRMGLIVAPLRLGEFGAH